MTIDDYLERELKRHLPKVKSMKNGRLHKMIMELIDKSLINIVLKETDWNQSDASRILGINRNTLRKKITNYKINIHKT